MRQAVAAPARAAPLTVFGLAAAYNTDDGIEAYFFNHIRMVDRVKLCRAVLSSEVKMANSPPRCWDRKVGHVENTSVQPQTSPCYFVVVVFNHIGRVDLVKLFRGVLPSGDQDSQLAARIPDVTLLGLLRNFVHGEFTGCLEDVCMASSHDPPASLEPSTFQERPPPESRASDVRFSLPPNMYLLQATPVTRSITTQSKRDVVTKRMFL